MIGFLSKAFKGALVSKTAEEHYAELIWRTETDRRRRTLE
jgi:hypothetical protein